MSHNWGKAVEGARTATVHSKNTSCGGGGNSTNTTKKLNTINVATKSRGAMIMKTVSILLASSRRASNQLKLADDKGGDCRQIKEKNKLKTMDDISTGKLTPKLLEICKKKTHFTKYILINYIIYIIN